MMNDLTMLGFKVGFLIAGACGFIGFTVGLIMNLLEDYGRG